MLISTLIGIYLIGLIVMGVGRLISFNPTPPDRTVFTWAIAWPVVVSIHSVIFTYKLLCFIIIDMLKLVRK